MGLDERDCRVFPGAQCLLTPGTRTAWTCEVCRTVLQWIQEGYESVFVGAAPLRPPTVAYLLPAKAPGLPETERQGCILSLALQGGDHEEIRAAINTLLLASDRTWLWKEAEGSAGERYLLLKPEPPPAPD